MTTHRAMMGFCAALALAACGGGGGGTTPPSLQEIPGRYADTMCGVYEACLGSFASRIYGGADCRAMAEAQVDAAQLPRWEAIVAAGTATYDPASAQACMDAVRALGCELPGSGAPAACRRFFTGTIAIGGACSLGEECVAGAYCATASCPGTAGTCTARSPSGGACSGSEECADGLWCESRICRAPLTGTGRACTASLPCRLDEICIGAVGTTPGTCAAITSRTTRTLGQSCDIQAWELCTANLACAITGSSGTGPTQVCVAPAGAGGSCNVAAPEMCPSGQYCDANLGAGTFTGTCQPLPAEGELCPRGTCASGLRCDAGTCERARENGEACTDGGECISAYCDVTCQAVPLCP